MKADIRARRTVRPSKCVHCLAPIEAGELVHVVIRDGKPMAAHVPCDLAARKLTVRSA